MKKQEFLDCLEGFLQDMPEGERKEALMYYSDYIEDAGPEKEEEVISALGSPEEVAKSIRNENAGGEYTELGYQDNKEMQPPVVKEESVNSEGDYTGGNGFEGTNNGGVTADGAYSGGTYTGGASADGTYSSGAQNASPNASASTATGAQKKKMSEETMAWTIVLTILLSPIWIPAVVALLGMIFTAACSFVGFAISGVVILLVSIVVLIAGIVTLFSAPSIGLMILGIALIIAAVGFILLVITSAICRYFIPWLWRGLKALWNKIFGKREVAGA